MSFARVAKALLFTVLAVGALDASASASASAGRCEALFADHGKTVAAIDIMRELARLKIDIEAAQVRQDFLLAGTLYRQFRLKYADAARIGLDLSEFNRVLSEMRGETNEANRHRKDTEDRVRRRERRFDPFALEAKVVQEFNASVPAQGDWLAGGDRLIAPSGTNVAIWDRATRAQMRKFKFDEEPREVLMSPKRDKALVLFSQGLVVLDPSTGKITSEAPFKNLNQARWSPDGTKIVVEASPGTMQVTILSAKTGRPFGMVDQAALGNSKGPIFVDKNTLLVRKGNEVAMVDMRNGNIFGSIVGDDVVMLLNGDALAVRSNGTVGLQELKTFRTYREFSVTTTPQQMVHGIALSADGKRLLVQTTDLLTMWDLDKAKALWHKSAGGTTYITDFAFVDATRVAIAIAKGDDAPIIEILDRERGGATLKGKTEETQGRLGFSTQITPSPDGTSLMLTSQNGWIAVMSLLSPVGD